MRFTKLPVSKVVVSEAVDDVSTVDMVVEVDVSVDGLAVDVNVEVEETD